MLIRRAMFSLIFLAITAVTLQGCCPTVERTDSQLSEDTAYLYSFFRDEKDGLYLAHSCDLLNWTEIPGPHLKPQVGDNIMRDPFLARGPDGTFHMVFTTGWKRKDVGYTSSKDLIHWTPQKLIGVMADKPGTMNCWAPKIFYDSDNAQWMIVWSSWLNDGSFPPPELPETSKQHRIWYATTKDFQKVTPAKVLFDPGHSVIDAYILKDDGQYLMFFKDERGNDAKQINPQWQNIRIAKSKKRYGPYGDISETITGRGPGKWHNEGPTAIKVDGRYYCFYDHHSSPTYFGTVTSTDLVNWTDISDKTNLPDKCKHGSILRVPKSIVSNLIDNAPSQAKREDAFHFTVTGDPRGGLDRWSHTLKQITEKVGGPGVFHITVGDYFEDDHSTLAPLFYKEYLKQFGKDAIWYPGVGNHEVQREQIDLVWLKKFYHDKLEGKVNPGPEETTYSWDYGIAHFVQFGMYYDGEKYRNNLGFTDDLLDWLEKDLDRNTKPVVFVIYHEPAWPNDRGGKDSPANWKRFMKILNDRKVVAGLCADSHTYARYQVPGDWETFTWEIDAGNAGRMSHGDKHQTFIDITVNPDGTVEFKTYQGMVGEDYKLTDSWKAKVTLDLNQKKTSKITNPEEAISQVPLLVTSS